MRWGGRPPAVPVSGEFTRGGPSGREEVIGVGLRNADREVAAPTQAALEAPRVCGRAYIILVIGPNLST